MQPWIFHAQTELRTRPGLADQSWDAERRELYLLRRDIERPLSADPSVWGGDVAFGERSFLPWIPLADVVALRASATLNGGEPRVVVVVGIVAEDDAERSRIAMNIAVNAELRVDPAWVSLGYDVVDSPNGVGTSGLMNCGYSDAAEARALRACWAPLLNRHGLFGALEDALAFRPVCERRVAEHAPFFVVGLWLVP